MNTFTSDILSLVFGGLMVIMTFAIEFPQMVSIIKTRNTSGTSLSSYIIFFVATWLWFVWALLNFIANSQHLGYEYGPKRFYEIMHIAGLLPAVLANGMGVFLLACVLFCKIKNLIMCKKLNVSEIRYSQIVFDRHKKDSWIKKYYPLIIIAACVVILLLLIILIVWMVGIPKQMTDPSEYGKYEWSIFGLNIVAAIFFEATSWPQFIKCMKTKDTSGISLGWAIFMPLSCTVSLSYDIFLAFSTDWRSVAASIICSGVIINILVLILKIRNVLKAKKLGISEWKYTNKYIATKKKTK